MYLECIAIRWSYRRTSLIAGNLRQEVRHRHKYWYSSTETDLMRWRQPRGEVLIVIPAVMLITSRSCRARSAERGGRTEIAIAFQKFLIKIADPRRWLRFLRNQSVVVMSLYNSWKNMAITLLLPAIFYFERFLFETCYWMNVIRH